MTGFVAAGQAGISAIPVNTTTKAAMRRWKEFQLRIPELIELQAWDQAGHDIAVICGEVSGRLMCLDFEVGFMGRMGELAAALRDEELEATFTSWIDGYSESTARGGLHVLVRLEGEGPCPRNDKFAFDGDGDVVIETRGEGGYVIVAPSRNGTSGWELLSGGFDSIAYATLEEWAQIEAVLTSFDATPAPPALTVPTRSTVRFEGILGESGPQWIEAVKADLPSMEQVIDGHGWVSSGRRDDFGVHWVRPGKNPREGHSASISDADRLWVYSSNAGLPTGVSLDVVDVAWCYETGRSDRQPTLEERTEWLQVRRPTPAERSGVDAAAVHAEVAALNLSPDFWTARGYLTHVHQAALALRLSPDAVWAGIKCFYAACIPWNHRLPGDGTMDYVAIVVGQSGAGKSQAKHAAWRLLESCWQIDGVQFPVPIGSGEGMTEVFVDRDNEDRRYKNRGAGFYADEGKFLLDIGGRSGSTTIQAIKQMWSGELTGTVAATKERHRWLEPRAVRATLLISTTPDIATQFMRQDLTDEGLPQRIVWAWAHYDHPDVAPDWPGPLDVHVWDHNRAPTNLYTVDLEPELAALIDAARLAAAKGQVDGLHEGHATYAMLKSAAIHAHLDARMTITMADWGLVTQEWEITRMVRRHILTIQHQGATDRNVAIGRARADQQLAADSVYLEKAAQSLRHKLHSEGSLTNRQIKDHLRQARRRHRIDHHEVINLVISRGWGAATEQGLAPPD